MIYRPGVYNLQTRTGNISTSKKLLEKVDGG